MLPHKYQVDFARRKGNVPYPCYYCLNFIQFNNITTDEHNQVKDFGTEANVPNTCTMGLRCPSEVGDCKSIQLKSLELLRWYPSALFEKFTRDYYLEMLTDIKCGQPITRSMLIARAHKGYNTREQRIQEMLDEGIITQSYNTDNEEIYSLTEYGTLIANEVCQLMDNYLIIKEQGELLAIDLPKMVFEWVRNHPNCTARQIYDYFGSASVHMSEKPAECALEDLVSAGYIEPLYDDNFEEIRFNTTQKGVDVWIMLKEKRQSTAQDVNNNSM